MGAMEELARKNRDTSAPEAGRRKIGLEPLHEGEEGQLSRAFISGVTTGSSLGGGRRMLILHFGKPKPKGQTEGWGERKEVRNGTRALGPGQARGA